MLGRRSFARGSAAIIPETLEHIATLKYEKGDHWRVAVNIPVARIGRHLFSGSDDRDLV